MTFVDTWKQHDFSAVSASITMRTADDVSRALAKQGRALNLDDLAALLSPAAAPFLEEMAALSHRLTVARFGRTMQLYAPMYLTNVCANICSYCGFSAQNRIPRKALDDAEILADGKAVAAYGFDHLLLVTGESSRYGFDYLQNAFRLLRPHFSSLSMEVQPLEEAEYAALTAEGLSAVLVYQETYDPAVYPKHHLKGPKADMAYRLDTPDRLGRAGVKKIGLGALYGLSDWRAESWFLGLHLQYMEKYYWRTRYSLSFPRLRPHEGNEIPVTPFNERELVQAACAFRLFSQEIELSLSTRESPHFRNHAYQLGFTSMSAGSRTNPGGYASEPESLEQFAINDDRPPAEVAAFLKSVGYEPVWKDWDASYDGANAPVVVAAN
ncbi:MAG: 2-iminoacetate synthase ThiH [Opitutus sp.]|nr:2-iminoacetate synthase ThiH [Opitutus sp.]MCS6246662.1 2-iminoacetate synthase ThiH [Opitutus sp.]MCS6272823.1 2-iminoacetate synthase ThiH [Opitutus sp.]MCS6278821.1 2-iminoacetate synthase ThiH [Opitutus sp.]MCS6299601.1 2-iminoacetate synthase ThiH [Opitutus sp.]